MTEAGERAMQLRTLVSAADSRSAWDLRCRIREGLIVWIQERFPEFLPRTRVDYSPGRAPALKHPVIGAES